MRRIGLYALLLIPSLSLSALTACNHDEPTEPPSGGIEWQSHDGDIVLETDSDEWRVYIARTSVLYGSGYSVDSPYHIPTKAEASTLRMLTFGDGSERFVTCDGYTFGMPSASVSKAGTKKKYSVLGLWRRKNTYNVPF